MDDMIKIKIDELVFKSLEGIISKEECSELESLLRSDSQAIKYYTASIDFNLGMQKIGTCMPTSLQMEMFLQELAKDEKTAPEIDIPPVQSQQELVQHVYRPREKRRISALNVATLVVSAAAMVFVVLFAKFAPVKAGVEVATLTDSIQAKWADTDQLTVGQRLVAGGTNYLLREGCAEILFDNNAHVTIEAPAEFRILTSDQIGLNYGRIYASVSEQAYGFTVVTPTTRIIDLGTEFGVQQDLYGNSELHVLKGRTNLISNTHGKKINMSVEAGSARKLSGVTGDIEPIAVRKDLFVREIDSTANLMWKGQTTLHLADIVGGGNGFGTGSADLMIDPSSGRISQEDGGTRPSTNDYHPAASNPYIDGVFVPNGSTRQIVSSQGHLFEECLPTNGFCCENIKALTIKDAKIVPDTNVLNVQTHYIFLHANMGITFDLEAIRRDLSFAAIDRFQSQCGIRKYAEHTSASNADFWVLVDGKVRYKKTQVKTGELHSINIELSENDRFLTLVETDGGDPAERVIDGQVMKSHESDWGFFADPVLKLQ